MHSATGHAERKRLMNRESKFLSRVLRHEPELVDLILGPDGWVLVDDLLHGMKKVGHRLN